MRNSIRTKATGLIAILLAVLFWAAPSFAIPVLNPYNGHYYEAIPGSFDWLQAQQLAQGSNYNGMTGYLATLTSQDENDWVWSNLNNPVRYLLGGTDRNSEGNWEWANGETWNYTNWVSGEPNDGFGNYPEDALSFWDDGLWNDLPEFADYWNDGGGYIHGYLVEYSPLATVHQPEPATMLLLGSGLLGAFVRKRYSI